jgi:hypothetical protein
MSKAGRILGPTSASSDKSDQSPLASIALFSGIGLLVSLLTVIMRMRGVGL